MIYNGIIAKKIEHIQERILKLESLKPLSIKILNDDFFLKSGIERTLQVGIEAMIDIAERIISIEGITPATTSFNALKRLQDLKILKDADRYKRMIQFRNFIVHRYESIDSEIIVDICNSILDDFKFFLNEIESYEKS